MVIVDAGDHCYILLLGGHCIWVLLCAYVVCLMQSAVDRIHIIISSHWILVMFFVYRNETVNQVDVYKFG